MDTTLCNHDAGVRSVYGSSGDRARARAGHIVVRGDDGRTYRLVEKLGQGGFGSVYRAWRADDLGVSRQVAIKVLKENVPSEVSARFRDEARMLGLVRHRAIVGLEGLVNLEGQLTAVLEYVPGVDLKAVIDGGRPPVRVALRIVEEVASALHSAYDQVHELTGRPLRLVHRDIKPANVRLTPGGEIRVVDFGGARAEFAQREAQTQSFVLGSYRYMAPERLDSVDSHESDVYSLGLVLGELIVGDEVGTPSKHHGQHDAFLAGLRDAVEGRLRREGVAPGPLQRVSQLLGQMLDYYPQRRPTAREVELVCRNLAEMVAGPALREWADVHVRALEHAKRFDATPVASRRAVLPQSADCSVPLDAPLESPSVLLPPPNRMVPTEPTSQRRIAPRSTASRPAPAAEAPTPALLIAVLCVGFLVSSFLVRGVMAMKATPPPVQVHAPVAPPPPFVRDWGPPAAPTPSAGRAAQPVPSPR